MRQPIAVPIAAAGLGLVMLAIAVNSFGQHSAPPATSRQIGSELQSRAQDVAASGNGSDALSASIQKAQLHLRQFPSDDQTWAELGSAYVQQARVTGDPTYYPKAEGALNRSLTLNSKLNWQAMVGMGALANARHEFDQALDWGRKARAVNAFNSSVYGVMDDALTQLGSYPTATRTLQKMLDLQPGIPAFTRASYQFEEHGQNGAARNALQRALDEATAPADIAFCHYYLGELSFNEGDPHAALAQDELGLLADPGYDPVLAGKAKAEAALGRTDAALRDYTTVIGRVPQPQYVLENGELLQSLGRKPEAGQQYRILTVEQQLLAANGVVDDLTGAVVDADHGSAASAVLHGRAEWSRRHSVLVADALAWALHRDGHDGEALKYSTIAGELGWRNATFAYHRGMIELALGHREQARTQLTSALKINPYFSVLQAPAARRALASLGGAR